MATLGIQVSRTSSTVKAYANVQVEYSTSTTDSAVSVTASSVVVTAVGYAKAGSLPMRDADKTQARSALSTALSSATVTLTYGGQTVISKAGLAFGTTYSVSGTKSVARGTQTSTATLTEAVDGKTSSTTISIPVLQSWAVNYDGNSGTAVPNPQTKYYGINIALSSSTPIKEGYTFKGWAVSTANAGAGTVDYAPSATYSANAGITLYAVWELNYQKPTISNLHVDRCQLDGTLDDDGEYALVVFDWSVFRSAETRYYGGSTAPYSANAVDSCTITVGTQTATPTLTGESGTVSQIVGNGSFIPDTSYAVEVSITDTQAIVQDNTTTIEGLLAMSFFPMDINADATAIGFFRPAPDTSEGAFFAKNVDAPSYSVEGTEIADFIVDQGTDDIWTYRKWDSGIAECWGRQTVASYTYSANGGYYKVTNTPPSGLFVANSNPVISAQGGIMSVIHTEMGFTYASATEVQTYLINRNTSAVTNTGFVSWYLIGKWK